eukprot:5958293-Amphidinium_carterae.1
MFESSVKVHMEAEADKSRRPQAKSAAVHLAALRPFTPSLERRSEGIEGDKLAGVHVEPGGIDNDCVIKTQGVGGKAGYGRVSGQCACSVRSPMCPPTRCTRSTDN